MDNDQIDTALVERVALALARTVDMEIPDDWVNYSMSRDFYMEKARLAIYPPAPPKTRLQVARELLAAEASKALMPPFLDDGPSMRAVLAALALPAMED